MTRRATSASIILTILTLLFGSAIEAQMTAVAQSQPAPVAYWKLNETGSAIYADAVGGNAGNCVGLCPTPDASGIGGSQQFNGAATGISVPTGPGNPFEWGANSSFSIEFWAKGIPGQTCTSDNEVVIGRNDRGSALRWWLGCREGDGRAHIYLHSSGSDEIYLDGPSSPSLSDGQWHHVVGVRDSSLNVVRLYVDGAEAQSIGHVFQSGFTATQPDQPLNIGWFDLLKKYHFNGLIDEVVIYNRALSNQEIRRNYEYGLAGFARDSIAALAIQQAASATTINQGENVTFTHTVTNPGNVGLSNVQVSSSVCASVVFVGGDGDGDSMLDTNEQWSYTCTASPSADTTATATVTARDVANIVVSAQAQTLIDVINPDIPLLRTVSTAVAYPGEPVTFFYLVSTRSNQDLEGVGIIDNLCIPAYVGGDNNLDNKINGGTGGAAAETWTFTCSVALSADAHSTAIATGTVSGQPVSDQATVFVDVINPGISLDVKVNPSTVYMGENAVYIYTVTNAGDDPLTAVSIQNDACDLAIGPVGDTNGNGKLDIGESWTFQCTTIMSGSVSTTVTVSGRDSRGGTVQTTSTASIELRYHMSYLPITVR